MCNQNASLVMSLWQSSQCWVFCGATARTARSWHLCSGLLSFFKILRASRMPLIVRSSSKMQSTLRTWEGLFCKGCCEPRAYGHHPSTESNSSLLVITFSVVFAAHISMPPLESAAGTPAAVVSAERPTCERLRVGCSGSRPSLHPSSRPCGGGATKEVVDVYGDTVGNIGAWFRVVGGREHGAH